MYRFGNQTVVLHCELKKEPLKKRLTMKCRRVVRPGLTCKFIKTTKTLQDGPHTCLLCVTQVDLPSFRVSYELPGAY